MEQKMREGEEKRAQRRLSLNTPAAARKALAKVLRQFILADKSDRESSDFIRAIIYGLSSLLADYRKEAELATAERVAAMEHQLQEIEEHRVARAS